VTVASKASLGAGASGVAYTTSKNAVIGLVKHIACFYGPQGVRSNAVLPGPVATNIGATGAPKVPWAMKRARLAQATMGPRAQPDEIAAAISWLASDEASNINGATHEASNINGATHEASNINGATLATDAGWSAA
jgi:NAD(P)-dependent dehydrogenase (short-subunit alcohol dehydrogenase family)